MILTLIAGCVLVAFIGGVHLGAWVANKIWSRAVDDAKMCCDCRKKLNESLDDLNEDDN
jgi:hypothetical protein